MPQGQALEPAGAASVEGSQKSLSVHHAEDLFQELQPRGSQP